MSELHNKVEAILFASGKPMPVKEIKRITKASEEEIQKSIDFLKERYSDSTSIMLVSQGDSWKMTVREKYLHLIRKIVTETELTKTVMETLAVIAWKSPVTQSDIIKIRTNKAYDHIKELKETGFVETVKHGRTKLLKLTSKFYEYFDIQGDKDIKKMLGGFSSQVLPQKKMNDFSEYEDNETGSETDITEEESSDDKLKSAEDESKPSEEIEQKENVIVSDEKPEDKTLTVNIQDEHSPEEKTI